MTCYSIEPRTRKSRMPIIIIRKYWKQWLDSDVKAVQDAIKTAFKIVVHKAAEPTVNVQ